MRSILRTLLLSLLGIVVGLAVAIALAVVVGKFWGTGRGVVTFFVASLAMISVWAAKSKGEAGNL